MSSRIWSVAKHAKRFLAGTTVGSTERIFPGYISFEGTARPTWWRSSDASEDCGVVLGVYENEPEIREDAMVVTDEGLGVLGKTTTWVPYLNIDRWEKLSKDPVSTALYIVTTSSERIELRFDRGCPFAFVQFLLNAVRCAEKAT